MCIVMVTNLKERNRRKCDQYWPNDITENENFGPFSIKVIEEQILLDFVIRSIIMKVEICINSIMSL